MSRARSAVLAAALLACNRGDDGDADEATTLGTSSDDGVDSTDDGPPLSCGDGIQGKIEICDDGNLVDGDGCDASCLPTEVLGIATGAAHTCVLLSAGAVKCWGNALYGALGYGDLENVGDDELPADVGPVELGGRALELVAGVDFTCVLLESELVRCWGAGTDGRNGLGMMQDWGDQLGETPAMAGDLMLGGATVHIGAGAYHACAVLADDRVRCWGQGGEGRLGLGNVANVGDDETPSDAGAVSIVNMGEHVAEVRAGFRHTCVRIAGTGALRCWGGSPNGELGYGNVTAIGDDEAVAPMDVALGGTVGRLALGGGDHTCVQVPDVGVRCWGANGSGQLGQGNVVSVGDDELPDAVAPLAFADPIAEVVAGLGFSCVLSTAGDVRCWGANGSGQLGRGDLVNVGDMPAPSLMELQPIALGGVVSRLALSVGGAHACALMDDGAVRCWGENAAGQLGLGDCVGECEDLGDDETPDAVEPVVVF